nr:hypothetical protein [uncultured Thermosynechococcus sp.]
MVVPPQNTSRTCPRRGHVSAGNRQPQGRFLGVAWGFEDNADWLGASTSRLAGGNPYGLWIELRGRWEAGTSSAYRYAGAS